jgi:hypothetical protein
MLGGFGADNASSLDREGPSYSGSPSGQGSVSIGESNFTRVYEKHGKTSRQFSEEAIW